MNNLISQTPQNVGVPLSGIGTYNTAVDATGKFTDILTAVIGVLTIIAGIWFIFLLITGGIAWMSSGGDKGKLANARGRMLNGAIGLAVVVAGLFIADILGGLVGLDDILDPGAMIESISP